MFHHQNQMHIEKEAKRMMTTVPRRSVSSHIPLLLLLVLVSALVLALPTTARSLIEDNCSIGVCGNPSAPGHHG
ncbi:hypothetical protein LINGRAHAP2_LOCUS33105 [Linum grandiflorum]